MDQFNPKDEASDISVLSDSCDEQNQALPPPPTPTNFYKEFVQFAIFLGVTLFPVYVFFDSMTESFRTFVIDHVHVLNPPSNTDVTFVLDKDFARVAVGLVLFATFTTIFFARRAFSRRRVSRLYPAPRAEITTFDDTLIQEKNAKIRRLEDMRQTHMEILRTIYKKLYYDDKPRLDFKSERASYYVTADGTLKVHKDVVVKAHEEEGFLWTFKAFGDPESIPLENWEDMHPRVIAGDKDTDLLFLPLRDEPLRKEFVIYFLPLLKPGETRSFTLYYEWPGSFLKLLQSGCASHTWSNRTRTEAIGEFYAEWRFDEKLGHVDCRNTGDKPPGLELKRLEPSIPTRWALTGDAVPLSDVGYELTFWGDTTKKR